MFQLPREAKLLVDLDGTLALRASRKPFEWDKLDQDQINTPVLWILLTFIRDGGDVVFFTGREEKLRSATERWLEAHLGFVPKLCMRLDGDDRKDSVVKRELFENSGIKRGDVFLVLDDRNQTVEMWRKDLNFTTFQVAQGNF